MTMMSVVAIAGANRDADILSLCGSCGANDSKTQNGGSDCNVFHACPPNASCWETKRFHVRFGSTILIFKLRTQRGAFECVNFWAVEISPPSQKGAV
jgi:hypothetical protein